MLIVINTYCKPNVLLLDHFIVLTRVHNYETLAIFVHSDIEAKTGMATREGDIHIEKL